MARVTRPGGRVVVLEITTPQKPPLSWFFRLWFDRVVPAARPRGRRPRRLHATCRARVRRFPGPRELARPMAAAGLADVRWVLTAGGIIAIHVGHRSAVTEHAHRHSSASVLAAGGPELRRAARAHRGAARARWPRATAPSSAAHAARHARRRRQAAAAGARVPVRRRRARTSGWWRPAWRSSCCTWPRSCTTTCSTGAELRRGRPTVFADGGRAAATATGDLLFSRAFAELAATGSEDAVRALSARLVGAGPRRADAARRRLEPRRDARSATSSAAG